MGMETVIAVKRKQILQAFRDAGATNAKYAKTPAELGLRSSLLLTLQVNKGVLVETDPGRLYLDEEREAEAERLRRRILFVFAFIGALAMFLVWFLTNMKQ